MTVSPYRGKRVVIVGLARQGVALARYLAQAGARVVATDRQPAEKLAGSLAQLQGLPNIELVLGEHPESALHGADWLFLSGGVSPDVPLAQAARARGIPLSNDTLVFLEACPEGVLTVGITGSAGKSTTTTLVGRMLAQAVTDGRVYAGGNLGNPLIAEVAAMRPGDVAVLELSSFQLELMQRSPQVAAVLNLTPNHLDRHGTLQAYAEAKSHILRHQAPGDVAVLGRDDAGARRMAGLVRGRLMWFSTVEAVEGGAWLSGERLLWRPSEQARAEEVARVAEVALRGRHNLQNVLAACAISGAAGAGPAAMRAGLRGFTGVAHRLELVREAGGVRWYNDSIATAPERVAADIRAFDEPLVLLLGGRDKKLPWEDLAALVRERVKAVVLFGEAAPLIARALEQAGVPADRVVRVGRLAEAVPVAAGRATPGDAVVLAPGGTSFDEFRDFEERGETFRALVAELEPVEKGDR